MTSTFSEENKLQSKRLVEIDATPDLVRYKPIVILKEQEFTKLVNLLDEMKVAWIAMKFNRTIFLFWGNLVFLHSLSCAQQFENTEDSGK